MLRVRTLTQLMDKAFVTRVLAVDPLYPNAEIIAQATDYIKAGQLVAFPTETVYGLGANAFDSQAVTRIFEAKSRPATDPVIVHVYGDAQLSAVAAHIPDLAWTLIRALWPGPLTLVLARNLNVPPNVSAGLATVAVRMPSHPVAIALLKAAHLPIAAPSANRFAHSSATTAQHVLDDLSGKIPLILDGGAAVIGVESTILDLSGDHPRLLRHGSVSLDVIRQYAPDVEVITRYAHIEDGSMTAPGMLLKHYSPRATLYLFDGQDNAIRAALAQTAAELQQQGRSVGLLIADEDRADLVDMALPMVTLGSLTDLQQIARNLFAGLRTLDDHGVEVILTRAYPPVGIGLAIRDRLIRAAEGRIIQV